MTPDADRGERVATDRARCLDKKAAATYLGVSENQIVRFINAGFLPIVKFPGQNTETGVDPHGVCRRVLLDVRDLDELIERSKETRGGAIFGQAVGRR